MSRYVMKRESGVDGAIMWATVLTGAFGVLMVYRFQRRLRRFEKPF